MKRLSKFVILFSLMLAVPIGCQTTDKSARNNNNDTDLKTPQQVNYRANEDADRARNGNRNGNRMGRSQMQQTANRLEKLATSVQGVEEATAVVLGRYTIIGVDLQPNLDRNRVGTVKYSVAQAVKNDPQGKNALVTADADMFHRLQGIAKKIADGQPITAITDEIADIAARLSPQPSKGVPNQKQ